MTVLTGSNEILTYSVEQDFRGSTTDDSPKAFGRDTSLTTTEFQNNGQPLYDLGQRLPDSYAPTNFSGSFGVSFTLASFEFLELLDDTTGSKNDGATEVYDLGDGSGDPQSFSLSITRRGSGIKRIMEGCVLTSMELSSEVDGTVTVSLSGAYADESELTGVDAPANPSISGNKEAITFDDTTLDYNTSTSSKSLNLPQGVTISVEQNNVMLSTLGQRGPADFSTADMSVSLSISHAIEEDNDDSLEDMYGTSGGPAKAVDIDDVGIDITFDNGNGEDNGKVTGTVKIDGFPQSYSESGHEVTADFVEGSLSFPGTSISIEVTES